MKWWQRLCIDSGYYTYIPNQKSNTHYNRLYNRRVLCTHRAIEKIFTQYYKKKNRYNQNIVTEQLMMCVQKRICGGGKIIKNF